MKKLLLSLTLIGSAFMAQSQVIVSGISPQAVQGSYDYGLQANEGGWPGQTDNGTWALALDFNINGTNVQGELVMVNDGTPGNNVTYGNLLSEEGCATSPAGAYAGKIAVIRRNTCNFSLKAYNAQLSGAIAVIIVNRDDVNINMSAGTEGVNVNIPVVLISNTDGNAIIAEMANSPVVMFIGNKIGFFADDAGGLSSTTLISKSSGVLSQLATNGTEYNFELGTRVYNYGFNDQNNVTVTANIDGPSGASVYSNTVGPFPIISLDSIDVYPLGTYSFAQFSPTTYPAGRYTLTYTIDLGTADQYTSDNIITSEFVVNDSIYTFAPLDSITNLPVANNYSRPSSNYVTYSSCMVIDNPNASRIGVEGMYFQAFTNASDSIDLSGEEMLMNVYRWEDVFTNLDDVNLAFTALYSIAVGYYYYPSDLQDQTVYGSFSVPVSLEDNQRYLACVQTVNPKVFLGYDSKNDYSWNEGYYLQPLTPIQVDTAYYASGFGMDTPSAMGLKVFNAAELSIAEVGSLEGIAYPNPATNVVTVSLKAEGSAKLVVTDIAGRIAMNNTINLVNGKSEVAISSLEAGIYVFNITLENGQTSQFNVVKK